MQSSSEAKKINLLRIGKNERKLNKQKGIKIKARQTKKGASYSKGIGKNGLVLKHLNTFSTNKLNVGDFCDLKITALGPNNVGIDEFSYGYSILIPNAQLGETVKAQIIKINLNKSKYAIAKKISSELATLETFNTEKIKVGDLLTVKVNKIYPSGTNSSCIASAALISSATWDSNLPLNYQLIIPVNNQTKVGQEIQIQVTKLKLKYGFAKILNPSLYPKHATHTLHLNNFKNSSASEENFKIKGFSNSANKMLYAEPGCEARGEIGEIKKGSKMTLILPKTAKVAAKYLVMRHNSSILFIKNLLGAKLGDKVRVKFTKIGSSFAIGQVIRISPKSSVTRLALVRKNLNEMLINGMHYGEKVVKCQAKMRNFIWNTSKTGSHSLETKLEGFSYANKNKSLGFSQASKSQGLFSKEEVPFKFHLKGRHLINLFKTRRCLNIGLNQLTKYAAKGRTFLFVGTKKPAAGLIARAALFSKTSFFVNTRWLGGMLTNWKTIIKSISKIRPILKEKQKVISNILQKRSKIQNRLIKKVLSLRKKSRVLIKKGKELIVKVKMSNKNQASLAPVRGDSGEIQRKLMLCMDRGQFLLEKRQNLLNKQNELKEKTLNIKESGFLIANKYKILLNQLKTTHTKFNDLRLLFLLNKELRKIQKLAKEQGKNQFILSYSQFKEFATLASNPPVIRTFATPPFEEGRAEHRQNTTFSNSKKFWLIPNPPQEILNKLLLKITTGFAINEITNFNSKETILGAPASRIEQTSLKNFSMKDKNTTSILKNTPSSFNTMKLVILTKLLSKFSRFLPYIKNCINVILQIIKNIETKITELKTNLKDLKKTLTDYLSLKNKINIELEVIKTKYLAEQQIIRVLKRKLKRHEAEKKLLQFLPKLRYLPTPKNQISVAIQLLMKRFVDPKMKYPLDLIYDEKLRKKSKKVAAARKKKWQRLETYFGGIANMTKLKKTQISKNVAIIIGQQEEINAIRECKKLGIKMFHIVDTNCNPSLADHFIPANDDSRNSIKYLLSKMVTRIRLAQKIRLRLKK
jgi:small subunit ribosomal protein S2